MAKKGRSRLTEEQQNELDQLSRISGLKGAAIGVGIGTVAAVMTYRRSPHFRALQMPMQAILPGSGNIYIYIYMLYNDSRNIAFDKSDTKLIYY